MDLHRRRTLRPPPPDQRRARSPATTTETAPTTLAPETPATSVPATSVLATSAPVTTSAPAVSRSRPIAADPRGAIIEASVAWTGDAAIVVGGLDADGQPVEGAMRYDPATDAWEAVADPPPSTGRIHTLTVWTGSEVLVLGGDLPDGGLLVSYGHAYDPATDTWRTTATPLGFVTERSPWAWTGTELLVWPWDAGGSTMDVTPIAYDPAVDTWRVLPAPPVQRRRDAASVWTGTEWVVWGGVDHDVDLADGAAYDPATGTWRVLAESPLSPRHASGVWTGTEMIVAAGWSGGDPDTGNNAFALGDGAAYDPATDTWRRIAAGPAHPGFEPVWTGAEFLMFAKGGVVSYDPLLDLWTDDCCGNVATAVGASPVWTGSAVLQIGSLDAGIGGSIYTP
jgi:hypothetical protein